jgi:UDPglucose 6-dehydrogenase
MGNIAIVGSGVVGQATGKGLAQLGHEVTFVDVREEIVTALAAEGYSSLPVRDLPLCAASTVVVCVSTPTVAGRIELMHLRSALALIADWLRASEDYRLVVMRSTVPPGTTKEVVLPILERSSGKKAGSEFGLCFNPEFLREVSAENDFLEPWLIVFGSYDDRSASKLEEVYAPLCARDHVPVVHTDLQTAEMAKYASNLFNATKISFSNEIWMTCRSLGIDGNEVMGIVARSAEGMWNPRYGTRGGYCYGGACLPKDTAAFLAFAESQGLKMPLLRATIAANEAVARQTDVIQLDERSAVIRRRAAALDSARA